MTHRSNGRGTASSLGASAAILILTACAASQLGATDANLTTARSSAKAGGDLFVAQCAGCHGTRGEGTDRAPSVLGIGALPEYPRDHDRATTSAFSDPQTMEEESRARPAGAPSRDPFRTAADLHRYVSTEMPRPKERAGTLADADYWSIVSFMLIAHGIAVPKEGATRENAGTISLEP